MNNLLSIAGLIDAKIRASDKDLPVLKELNITIYVHNMFSPCSAKIRASDKDLPVLKEFNNGHGFCTCFSFFAKNTMYEIQNKSIS